MADTCVVMSSKTNMCNKTNLYATQTGELNWNDTNIYETKELLGLFLQIGSIKK